MGFVLLLFITFIAFATFLSASVPPSLNVQGRLTDDKGVNREGNLTFVFTIYDAPAGGKNLWKRTYLGVKVRNGSFSVALGSPNGKDDTNRDLGSIFDGSERWVGIQVEGPGGTLEPELIPRQHLVTVPHAFVANVAGNGVPVGGIIDWYRPTFAAPIPDGYQICDGSAITDPESSMQGQNTPNLMDKITYGVPLNRVGETGGTNSLNLQHSHIVNSHTHDLSNHIHIFNSVTGYANEGSVSLGGNGAQPVLAHLAHTHNYSGTTSPPSLNQSGSSSPGTDSQLSVATDNRQAYVGVIKIIRIK